MYTRYECDGTCRLTCRRVHDKCACEYACALFQETASLLHYVMEQGVKNNTKIKARGNARADIG